ncbi:MAG: hypothetical protein O7C60_06775 [Rickettsia endosymbiont of Ixodes persulcatus]|nr:hypothetical protein [Rickettsia endosymbiont of Ixodes persulcatus]
MPRNGSYADSIHSTDGLTAMAAPFGYSGGGGESQTQLVGPDGRMMMMRAPSYRTMPSEQSLVGLGEWDEKLGGGYPEFDRTGTPKPQRAMTNNSIDSMSGLGYAQTGGWEESYGASYPQQQQHQYRYQEEELRAPSRNQSRGPSPQDPNNMAGRGWGGGGYGR